MVIPEGNWYCPDCGHDSLLEKLEDNLAAYEKLYKSKEAEIKRKQRLAYVNMSLSNMIPKSTRLKERKDREREKESEEEKKPKISAREKRARRRQSDGSDSGNKKYFKYLFMMHNQFIAYYRLETALRERYQNTAFRSIE